MEFFTYSDQPRPIRLCEATRAFANDSLNHKYGKDTKAFPAVTVDHIADFPNLSDLERHDACIHAIVTGCPIRICEGERLSGAATLGRAIDHVIPATYGGEIVFGSVSHLTVDFETVLKIGIEGLEAKVAQKQSEEGLSERQAAFLRSASNCLADLRLWHGRYLAALCHRPEYRENYNNLCRVPLQAATTFAEALQSIWFCFAFLRLCGNWPGIGRIDVLLGDYLEKDLAEGRITLDDARELMAHFLIKGCEWICGGNYGSGDAQHYQNLVLGGVDEEGREVTNEVTYLVLDVLEELNISDFPTTVRLNKSSPRRLLRRVAEVMRHGGGVLAVYGEDTVIEAMTSHGYSLTEARRFANDGCWETQVPGKTHFAYMPFDGLSLLLKHTLKVGTENVSFDSMDDLLNAWEEQLDRKLRQILDHQLGKVPPGEDGRRRWVPTTPCTAISLFEEDCIGKAASYLEGGTVYTVFSPHLGGAADVGNSLCAIDRLCFREKKLTLPELLEILSNNWEGHELLRQYVLHKITYYGNDDDEADAYTVDVIDRFAKTVLKYDRDLPFRFVPGISTFGRQIEWRYNRPASPHGHRRGEILAPNMGATPGSDTAGATALIRSYCKLKLTDQVTGAALDVKLLPSAVKGAEGVAALMALMRGFVALGGCFMQLDVVDNEILKDAQRHPERYESLSVRISGWNARFVTLNKEWQDMVIEKTAHGGM